MEMCHIGEILKNKQMNCVGASVLGGALLEKVGIKYLVGHIGEHVLLITLTSDGKVYWQDMQDGLEIPELNNEELTSEKIEGASPVDIVSYAHSPSPEGLRFGVNKKHWEQKIMTALPPETGLELQELISTGFVLGNNNKNDEAIEILEVAKAIYPYEVDVHFGLARAYKNKKMYKQALEACGLAMQYDPGNEYLQGIYQEIESLVGR
jgi:tetratricopeptide (TPR) repeat protein